MHVDATACFYLMTCSYRFLCPDPALPTWCGNLRDLRGKLVLDVNGNAQSVCSSVQAASSCPSIPNWASKASPKTESIPSNSAASISATRSDNTPVAVLDIPANTVSEMSFVVAPVADSVYQAGSFSTLYSSGRLRSPLIAINPNGIIDARSGGITLTLAVDVPTDKCMNATSNMKVSAGKGGKNHLK